VNSKVATTVSAIIAAHAFASAYAQNKEAGAGGFELEEVVVSAQRRNENIQDVPITIQALTSETIDNLKVVTLDEFLKYLPNVQTGGLGPSQGNISIRGLSIGGAILQGGGSVGQWPTVGLFLDDQGTQMPGRNLDVYAADLERIEVLEGPQGTLFGAGAQAGALRYITNKPNHGKTEVGFKAGYGTTAGGADSSSLQAVLNLPVTDKLALRAVMYNDSRGGYIDNVPATFTRRSTDAAFALRTNGRVPVDSIAIDNYKIARNDINPVTYKGMRLGLSYNVNEDWNVLLTQSYQDLESSGVFYQMPFASDCPTPTNVATCTLGGPTGTTVQGAPLQRDQVTLFNDTNTTDKFRNTALTVNGKIGQFDFVYSGAYLLRDNLIVGDYTNYARGVYGAYYQCTGYSGASVTKCYSPSSVWNDTIKNTNQSHEIRFSTPTEWKVTGVAGVFWERRNVNDDTEWLYKSLPECTIGGPGGCFKWLDPLATPKFANASLNNPNRRNAQTGFFDDFKRTYEQKAAFLSMDWHITNTLTLTGGTRYFRSDNQMLGANVGSFFCKNYQAGLSTVTGPCTGPANGTAPYGTNLDNQAINSFSSKGFRSRVNFSWKAADSVLFYATWSQGFRPGGFNRGSSQQLRGVDRTTGVARRATYNQWQIPFAFDSDDLVNKEIGWKTTLFSNRLQFNGAIYQETWKNVQSAIFAPQAGFGNLTIGVNGPSYETKGISVAAVFRATQGLTIEGSMAYNKAELTNSPQFINNIPGTPGFGQAITETWVGSAGSGGPVAVVNVFGQKGDPSALAPKLQMNARVRYEWTHGDYGYYGQVGATHQGERASNSNRLQSLIMPSSNDFSLSLGTSKANWTADLVVSNLSNSNVSQYTSNSAFVTVETPPRPRTIGLQIGYKLGE
jgi:outer membrane receptor protein involved in Fe transport